MRPPELHPRLIEGESAARAHGVLVAAQSADAAGLPTAVGGSAPAREARPSLEEATLKSQLHLQHGFHPGKEFGGDVWTVNCKRFSSGVVVTRATLFAAWKRPRGKSESADSVPSVPAPSVPKSGERFKQSVDRSRRVLREKCFELNADHMLTLTKRGKFSSVDELWAVFRRFNLLMTKMYKDRWRYVAVPELHGDGETYHMHCAINGFLWAGIVRKIWQRALGGKGNEAGEQARGNVDLKAFRKYRGGAAAIRRVAGYISKYVGKGFSSGSASRRLYSSSRGLDPAEVQRFHIRDWLGVPEVAMSIQRWLCGLGADAQGDCFHWSRTRSDDEKLLAMGFILTSFIPQR